MLRSRHCTCYNAVCLFYLLLTSILLVCPDALLVPTGYVLGLCAPHVMRFQQACTEGAAYVLSMSFHQGFCVGALVALLSAVLGVPASAMARIETTKSD